ncbi:IS110 family transposase, partial [Novipirellula aureliae]|uniref:IS110 family transposase n=1 Tax=Novipirellula aureliae TaxID=2527966 RepID=UPI0011B41206
MKSNQESNRSVVGIDVAKDKLDFFTSRGALPKVVENDEASFKTKLGKKVKSFKDALFVVEATGGYGRQIVKWLQANDLDVAIVNPKQVRHFAKGIGHDAKTDPIDAKV